VSKSKLKKLWRKAQRALQLLKIVIPDKFWLNGAPRRSTKIYLDFDEAQSAVIKN